MISYQDKDDYIAVKWKKTQIGRIYKLLFDNYVYRPRGCGGNLESESFQSLEAIKRYLEGGI